MDSMNHDKNAPLPLPSKSDDKIDKDQKPPPINNRKNIGGSSKSPQAIIQSHCPAIMEAIDGKDALLKETAESTLSWIVFGVSGTDLNYAIRAVADMEQEPVGKLESAEARFLELKRIVTRARGDADLNTMAEEMLKIYGFNICTALNNEIESRRVKKAAEQALSEALLGRSGADYHFVRKYISDNIQTAEDKMVTAIKQAELKFIDTSSLIKSITDEFKNEKEKSSAAVIQSIQFGISRYNILFVLILIVGLGWSAMNLPQSALALVSASIGAAIAHLLAERNAVLGQKQKSNSNANENQKQ